MSKVVPSLKVRVNAVNGEAEDIKSFELVPIEGELPHFTAGAHIDLHLGNGLTRSYSLVNSQGERHRYIVVINKDAASRGGSIFVHEHLRAGCELTISAPYNNFPLVEDAGCVVFIAGGIDITPLWCMLQRLEALGRSWILYYSARTRQNAAFLRPLQALAEEYDGRIHLNFDGEPGGRRLDLQEIVKALPADAHVYCCGPVPMLAAFENACAARPPTQVHVEYFSPKADSKISLGGFTVVLARSGRSFSVPTGKSILGTLLDNEVDAPYSCTEGVCGTCKVDVMEGVPDHKDSVLTQAEQETNQTIMICCSGSKTERLVLDL
jgi:tetrachlorobenzoquinone reductase